MHHTHVMLTRTRHDTLSNTSSCHYTDHTHIRTYMFARTRTRIHHCSYGKLGKAALEMACCYRGSTTATFYRERVCRLMCLATSLSPKNKSTFAALHLRCTKTKRIEIVRLILGMAGIFAKLRGVLYPTPLKVDYYRTMKREYQSSFDRSQPLSAGLPAFCKFLNTFFQIAQAHGTWQWIADLSRNRKEEEAATLRKASKCLEEYSDLKYDELGKEYNKLRDASRAASKEKKQVLAVQPALTNPDTHAWHDMRYTAFLILSHTYSLKLPSSSSSAYVHMHPLVRALEPPSVLLGRKWVDAMPRK